MHTVHGVQHHAKNCKHCTNFQTHTLCTYVSAAVVAKGASKLGLEKAAPTDSKHKSIHHTANLGCQSNKAIVIVHSGVTTFAGTKNATQSEARGEGDCYASHCSTGNVARKQD